jgi:hypothetical protein
VAVKVHANGRAVSRKRAPNASSALSSASSRSKSFRRQRVALDDREVERDLIERTRAFGYAMGTGGTPTLAATSPHGRLMTTLHSLGDLSLYRPDPLRRLAGKSPWGRSPHSRSTDRPGASSGPSGPTWSSSRGRAICDANPGAPSIAAPPAAIQTLVCMGKEHAHAIAANHANRHGSDAWTRLALALHRLRRPGSRR